jgi:hypothetical protein
MDRQIVLAFSLAPAHCADSFKIAENLRFDTRKFCAVQVDLLEPPPQQVRGVGPFSGKNRELAAANAQVARDALHLGMTAPFKLRQPSASAGPGPPPTAKSVNESRPFIGLGCTGHSSLHAVLSIQPWPQRGTSYQTYRDPRTSMITARAATKPNSAHKISVRLRTLLPLCIIMSDGFLFRMPFITVVFKPVFMIGERSLI